MSPTQDDYISLRDDPLNKALIKALRDNDFEAMIEALDAGADLEAHDKDGNTALHYAVRKPIETGFLDELLYRGANVNAENNVKDTPLHLTVIHEAQEAGRRLLQWGAEVNPPNARGEIPWHQVFCRRNHALIRDLYYAGAHITRGDNKGQRAENFAEESPLSDQLYKDFQHHYHNDHMVASLLKNDEMMDVWFGTNSPYRASRVRPGSWDYLPAAIAKRREAGNPVVAEEFMEEVPRAEGDKRPRTLVGYAARDFRLPQLFEALREEGVTFWRDELFDADGTPGALMHDLAEQHQLRHLFEPENWHGSAPGEVREVIALMEKYNPDWCRQLQNRFLLPALVIPREGGAQGILMR